ncbi:MAG TPA: SusC/RagA family TonB-linked outer membrane protein [Chitinophagaceae bacterium]
MKSFLILLSLLTILVPDILSQQKTDTIPKSQMLDTVSVISNGYQTIARERITGSFEVIKEKQLNQRFTPDLLSRLESVSTILFDKSNLPLRPKITIRGISSINASKEPLIILDNFPFEGDLSTINPNTIESITILRDAAAASIWGTRAGNGVIVITTKKSKYGQPLQMDLTINTSVITKPDLFSMPIMSSEEVIEFEKWLFAKGYRFSDTSSASRPAFSPAYEILFKQRSGLISQQDAQLQLDNLKAADIRNDYKNHVYRTAINKQYAISASGGSQRIAYRFTGGFDHNIDQLGAKYQRITLRAENKFSITNKLSASVAIAYTNNITKSGQTGYSPTREYLYLNLLDDNGNEIPRYRYRQPYIDTAGQGKLLDWKYYPLSDYKFNVRENKSDHLLTNFILQYQLLDGLQVSANYQLETEKSTITDRQGLSSYYARDLINRFSQINPTTKAVTYIIPKGDIVDRSMSNLNSRNLRTQLNLNKVVSSFSFNAVAGAEIRERKDVGNNYRIYGYDPSSSSLSNVDYVNPYPNYITKAGERILSNLFEGSENIRYVSVFANSAITFLQKYTLTMSGRRDASNLFGVSTNEKWTPQWSIGGGWTISNEKFFSSEAIRLLKLRFSYGTSGNVDQSRAAVTTIRYLSSTSLAGYSQALISQFPNPSLKWERMSMANVALDFNFYNDRLNGSIEYYSKKGTDLFGTAPIDYTTGLGVLNLTRNIANTKGNGVDIILNGCPVDRSLKWDISLLFSLSKSEVTKYNLTSDAGFNYVSNGNSINPIEGKPVYSILSYPWAGLNSQGNPQSILNGQVSTDYAAITGSQLKVTDLFYSGPAIAPVYGSIANNLSYKNLELTFNIGYKFGYYFRRSSVSYSQLFQSSITHFDYSLRWQKPGDEAFTYVPSLQYPNDIRSNAFFSNSAILATKADHIRLSFVNLSYIITKREVRKLPFQQIQITLNATNLGLLWRANKFNIDPEYPDLLPAKQYSIGIKASL